jgi:hypothetical protein
VTVLFVAACLAVPVIAATKPSKAAASAPGAKAAPTKAGQAAKASNPGQGFSEAQLLMASQVLTGRTECEFKQYVVVERVHPEGGVFRVKHQGVTYTMAPEETSTGAVRLYDKKAGVVWLQIPVKSMLMNSRAGRRMVDACVNSVQRLAQAEAEASAASAAAAAASEPTVPPSMLGRDVPPGALPAPPAAATTSLLDPQPK